VGGKKYWYGVVSCLAKRVEITMEKIDGMAKILSNRDWKMDTPSNCTKIENEKMKLGIKK